MTPDDDDAYPCVGYCQVGPEGYCLGCGRPEDDAATATRQPTVPDAVPTAIPERLEPASPQPVTKT